MCESLRSTLRQIKVRIAGVSSDLTRADHSLHSLIMFRKLGSNVNKPWKKIKYLPKYEQQL